MTAVAQPPVALVAPVAPVVAPVVVVQPPLVAQPFAAAIMAAKRDLHSWRYVLPNLISVALVIGGFVLLAKLMHEAQEAAERGDHRDPPLAPAFGVMGAGVAIGVATTVVFSANHPTYAALSAARRRWRWGVPRRRHPRLPPRRRWRPRGRGRHRRRGQRKWRNPTYSISSMMRKRASGR